MKLGIIGAMEEEIRCLLLQMKEVEEHTFYQRTYYEGILNGKSVVLVECGIGKVNASIVATLLVEHFNVDLLINTGSAGAIDEALDVGDIVIADRLTFHDVDVTAFGYEMGQMAGMPAYYYTDPHLNRYAQEACRQLGIEPILGQIVSGDEFVSSPTRLQEIKSHFPRVRACDMESAAIAQVAYVLEVPVLIIRAISDNADQSASIDFDTFILEAGRLSAEMISQSVKLIQ